MRSWITVRDRIRPVKLGSLVLGNLVVSLGLATTGIHSFDGNVVIVFVGYLLLVVGYKIIWYGTNLVKDARHLAEILNSIGRNTKVHASENWHNYILIAVGLSFASYGTVIFTGIITGSYPISQTLTAGALCFGGYMVSHLGVNEFLV